LVLDRGAVEHRLIRELPRLLPEGALLVVNDSRVRRARVLGARRQSGGKVELLMLGRLRELEQADAARFGRRSGGQQSAATRYADRRRPTCL